MSGFSCPDPMARIRQAVKGADGKPPVDKAIDNLNIDKHDPEKYMEMLKQTVGEQNGPLKVIYFYNFIIFEPMAVVTYSCNRIDCKLLYHNKMFKLNKITLSLYKFPIILWELF